MNTLLSVIVPVYQTKNYLKECVSSILRQTYPNIEIILVDDGSTDGSAELCDELSDKNGNVHTIHIKNSGPYMARKKGVKFAHGEVVTFVDSDDWIESSAYQNLMELYERYKPDIICFSYKMGDRRNISENYYDEGLYERKKIMDKILSTMMYDSQIGGRKLNPSVCCKLFNKSLYKKVSDGIDANINWGEDALITYPAVCLADSLYITHEVYYNYRSHELSSIHTFPAKRIDELATFWMCIHASFKALGLEKEILFQLECYMRHFIELLSTNRFGIHSRGNFWGFPYICVDKGIRIQIYGAGEVGKSYVYELLHSRYAKIVGWYDKNYENIGKYAGIEIQNPKEMKNQKSDMILIALQNKATAMEIKKDICKFGIASKKIVWEQPIMRW